MQFGGTYFVHGSECRNVGLALGVELNGCHIAEHSDRILHGCGKYLPYRGFVLKLDFGLGGVYVYVDVFGFDGEVDEIRHLVALGYESFVGCHHRLVEVGMLHVAAVDKEVLARSLASCRLGFAYESRELAHRGVNIYGQEVLVDFLAEHVDYALAQARGLEVVEFVVVVVERECHVGIDEGYTLESRDDIVELGGVRLEELAPHWNVVE